MKNYIIPILFCSTYLNGQGESTNNSFGITIPSGVGIEISGEVEVEFIDVEGKGGAQYRDEFIQKVDYRSPFVEIDKTVLDFKLLYTDNLTYNFSLRFDDDGAYADKHFLKYQTKRSTLEFGKNRPLIALKRKTEGYPLIGTAYWKGRQYHLDYQRNFSSSSIGLSVALKRLIGYDAAAEDKSFEMMVYDDTKKIDGQTLEFGMRAETSFEPLKLQGWYYFGKLVDDEEWKKRLHYDFDYYATIHPYPNGDPGYPPSSDLEITEVYKDGVDYMPVLERFDKIYPTVNIMSELEEEVWEKVDEWEEDEPDFDYDDYRERYYDYD